MPDRAAPRLPPSIRVIERGWLSANNIVLFEGEDASLVDSGYVAHASQTLALVREVLHGRTLARLFNTHVHSDHVGGNAALAREFGCEIRVPSGSAEILSAWNEDTLLLSSADQRGERFAYDALIASGERWEMGELEWRAWSAPGHDMDALVFHCEQAHLLISGDALWQDGFGILFVELLGSEADRGKGLAAVRQTLDMIGRLAVDVVIPGHGPAFDDVEAALERAYGRLRAFEEDPARIARNALRGCLTFAMMDLRRMPLADLPDYLIRVPLFREANARFLQMESGALADWLARDLVRSGALRVEGDWLLAPDSQERHQLHQLRTGGGFSAPPGGGGGT